MRIDSLALRLRPRTAWESADLGVRLCQQAWRSVFPCAAVVMLPVALVAFSLVEVASWWPPVVIWWAKPWLDRTLLFALSRAAFGQRTTPADVWRARRHVWFQQAWHTVTLRRLSPWRSFTQSVYQLEGSGVRRARARAAVIKKQGSGTAALVMQVFLACESALCFGTLSLLFWFAPRGTVPDPSTLLGADEPSFAFIIALNVTYVAAIVFVEPFYVASGFAMYLNRRAQLEAWDVEQELRRAFASPTGDEPHEGRTARRTGTARRAGAGAAAALVACAWLLSPGVVLAQEATNGLERPSDAEVARAVEAVKRDPNLATERTFRTLRWKPRDQQPPQRRGLPAWLAWTAGLIRYFNESMRFAAWLTVAAGAIAVAAYLVVVARARRAEQAPDDFVAPSHVQRLDIRPESLPDDVGGAARALWDGGEQRAALALLYRGLLSRLAHAYRAPIRPSTTEGDCVRLAAAYAAPDGAAYASALVSVWRDAVYGGLAADTSAVHHLCGSFSTALAPAQPRDALPGEPA